MSKTHAAENRRSYRLTRLGFHFLFVGTFAMLGGALRGFNLLLVLAGLLVGALIIQWRWSRRSIEQLSARRRLPTEAFVDKPFRVRFRLHNQGRLLPAWMLRIEDAIELPTLGQRTLAVCGVGVISPGQAALPHYDCVVSRRGKYSFGPATLSTTFPFCLFTARRTVDDGDSLCVYPKLFTLRHHWQRRLLNRGGGVTVTARRSGPTEGDFYGLREWQSGDQLKWIHWRTTARIGEPAVRQFEQQRRFDTCVLIDSYLDGHSQANEINVENAISLAATFLVHLVGSPSNRLVLAVAARSVDAIMGGGSREGKRRMLAALAEIEPCPNPSLSKAAQRAKQIVGQTQDLLVISPRSCQQAAAADPELQAILQPWQRRGSMRWIDVSGSELNCWVIHSTSLAISQADLRNEPPALSMRDVDAARNAAGRNDSRSTEALGGQIAP